MRALPTVAPQVLGPDGLTPPEQRMPSYPAVGDFSKGFNDQVKRAIYKANKQIKMSDYKTPTSFDGYPQGQVEI